MNNVVITHTDADGLVSAAIVNKYLKHMNNGIANAIYFRWNYGNPTDEIENALDKYDDATIWLTDITLPDEFMAKYANRIMWFDHHKSAIEKANCITSGSYKLWVSNLRGNFSAITVPFYFGSDGITPAKQVAACELVWLTLFPGTPMPPVVRAIGRYDVWDNTEETFAVHEYLTSYVANSELNGRNEPDFEGYFILSIKKIFLFGWVSELLARQDDFRTGRYRAPVLSRLCKASPFLGMLL
ncbi:MAG: hypothetical protein IKO41_21310, partial [Lachnospiraceae bacterium]|nr:hypothetical protein [Lachnospiraceae bacterium]